ncbi:hypothetical protein GQ457_06G006150 [Hibiscus cannabinus]
MPTSTTEATVRPTELAPEPPTTRFGPWMVVEKRPRRPLSKEAVARDISSSVTITESHFAHILDANTDDLLPPEQRASINAPSPPVPVMEFTGPSTTNQDATPRKYSKTNYVSSKQSLVTLKSKSKSSTVVQQATNFNVRKPLQLNLVDFPILSRNGHKAGSSKHFSQIHPAAMSRISFALFLNDNGEWDVTKLSSIFTTDAVPYILGVKPPDPHAGPDVCVWRWTDHHAFELKSAYHIWSQSGLDAPDPLWKHIWALQIWQTTVPPSLLRTFFSASVKDWLRQNLYSNIMFRYNIPWKLFFVSILWQSWKNRNDVVFAGNSVSFEHILSRSIVWENYFNDGWLMPSPITNRTMLPTPWSNPKPGWLRLNVDGFVSPNTGIATIGGLLRDNAGNFIFGFSKFIGCVNNLYAELWSLYIGLQLAWDYGIEYLRVQTDCKQVLQLLQDPHVESCSISLVRSIRQFWQRAWFIDLTWIPRFGNMAADKLARLASHSSIEPSFLSSPPAASCDILAADSLVSSL